MITALVTKEKMDKWKRYFEKYASSMRPNRKTGREIDEYFRAKYPYQVLDSGEFCAVVEENVMANEYFREKVPPGMRPQIKSYMVGDVYVGIDIESGEFHIECGDKAQLPLHVGPAQQAHGRRMLFIRRLAPQLQGLHGGEAGL